MAETYVAGREKHELMHREEAQTQAIVFKETLDRIASGQEERTKSMQSMATQMEVQATVLQQHLRPQGARTRQTDNA